MTDSNRWPSPARLATSLAKSGFKVSAVCMQPGHPLLKTRAVQQTFPYNGAHPLESLRVAIKTVRPELIIPCDDRCVMHLHELYNQERQRSPAGDEVVALIERSLGPAASYPIVSSRYELLRIAHEEGLAVPRTVPVNNMEDLQEWQASQTLPWVLKVDGTWGGQGVKIVRSPDETEQIYRELINAPRTSEVVKQLMLGRDRSWLWPGRNPSARNVVAQAHVSGRPANCAVVCWKGEVLAGIGVEVITAQGQKGPAIIVRVVESRPMMLAAERIARRLGLSGFFGLDFMIETRTGTTFLIEMNARCTPLCHFQLGQGRDLAGALWARVSGKAVTTSVPVTQNDLIAYFPQAWMCGSPFLLTSYQDIPQEDPDLAHELLHPWCDRSILGRTVDALRKVTRKTKGSKEYSFESAMSTASPAGPRPNSNPGLPTHRLP